jgi:hypothetical protein
MADDTNAAQGPTDTAAPSAVQPVTSLLTTPQADDAVTDPPADPGAATMAAPEAKTDPANPEGDKPEGDEADKDKPQGAPEKYEFTAPEGVTLDAEAVAEFEPVAKELNLSNEQAQKLVELQTKLVHKQQEAWDRQVETWVTEINADKEIGGQAVKQSITHAQRALTQFGTPELKAALDATKMGNHPELVRVFARIGKAMAEDTFVPADKPAGTKRNPADVMYDKT